jgi:amidohydrolase
MMEEKKMQNIKVNSELFEELIKIRRHLHQYPELSFEEYETSNYIRSILEAWNISYQQVGETGLIVDIVGEKGDGAHIGIRADIDALPIQENTGFSFSSKNEGIMHACGHDGHTTILLGTVYMLNRFKDQFAGRVRCIFQPGEEADGAAEQMIKQGVLENPKVNEMLALHLWPHIPFGTVGVKDGAITASCDQFKIVINGKSGHSARPHQGIDAIAISSHVIQALLHLVVKENNPLDPIVVHVGKINGGVASNVIADKVVIEGTLRCLVKDTRKRIKERVIQLVQNVVESYGGKAEVMFANGHPAVINDDNVTKLVEEAVLELYGEDALIRLKEPSMGADDFGSFAEQVPSTYFRLGIKKENELCYDLHHPQFQFDERIIAIGIEVFTLSVLKRLEEEGK